MLGFLFACVFAKAVDAEEDFTAETEERRPVMVVGSYLGFLWMLHNKKDQDPTTKKTANSNLHHIPCLVVGYGDVLANHFYLGIEGNVGYGLKHGKDVNNTTERIRWHISGLGHVGFCLSPSARLYGIVGIDKTHHYIERDATENGKTFTKTESTAHGLSLVVGAGLLITISSRFGFAFEGRYIPPKTWTSSDSSGNHGHKLSAWQMGMKAILFI